MSGGGERTSSNRTKKNQTGDILQRNKEE
jgi:hypothetical protein